MLEVRKGGWKLEKEARSKKRRLEVRKGGWKLENEAGS
jgi:hypothetical protein